MEGQNDGVLSDLLAYARFWFAMAVTVVGAILGFCGATLGLFMPRKLGRRWMLQFPVIWARMILWAARCPIDAQFEAPLPEGGIFIFANHQSTLDIIALFLLMKDRPISFAVKRELFGVPIMGWYLRMAGFIEVDRNSRERAIKNYAKAGGYLREGATIGIYPEGTRSIDGSVLPFKKGPFVLAIETQMPIVPIAVDGAQRASRKHTKKLYGTTIHVRIGKAIETRGLVAEDRDALLIRTRKEILALHLKAGAAPSPEEPMIAPPGKRTGERQA